MGGSLTTMIRFSDGEILSKETWTNRISFYLQSLEFLNEDKEFIKTKIFHKDDADFRAPSEYGIVFFDFMKRNVISLQDYSDPSECSLLFTLSSIDRDEQFNRLLSAGYLKEIIYKNFRDESKTYREPLGDIKRIQDFFFQKYPILASVISHLDVDKSQLPLRDIADIHRSCLLSQYHNPTQEELLEWSKEMNYSLTTEDFIEPDSDKIKNIKGHFFVNKMSNFPRLLEDCYLPIVGFDYEIGFKTPEDLKKLKGYLDKEGITFSHIEEEEWESNN